jgi:hypothetical protein
MDARLPNYDPQIIERFADRLYEKAKAFVASSVVAGAALGASFGAVPLTSLGASWPIPSSFGFATMLVGAVAGSVLGYRIGDARSFAYMLQAQTALCQLQIERNTAAAATRPAAEPVLVPPPAPTPEAVAPRAVAAPAPEPEPEPRPVVVPADVTAAANAPLLRVATPVES